MSTETPLSATPMTTLHRHKERARTDRGDLYAVLDAGLICHLGVVIDGVPVVLPTAYGRQGDRLYLHGSSANRSILAADGQEVCVWRTRSRRLQRTSSERLHLRSCVGRRWRDVCGFHRRRCDVELARSE